LKEVVEAGAESLDRGMKVEEWKIYENRVVVAVIIDWFGWLKIPKQVLSGAVIIIFQLL